MKQFFLPLLFFSLFSYGYLQACVVGNPPTSICDFRSYDTSDDLNWTTTTFDYYKAGSSNNPVQLQSPFHTVPGNANGNIYFLSATPEKDYSSNDGWRYVTHDFGELLPDNTERTIRNPYFVLYNYRSSILRVFIAVDELWDQNKEAMVTIDWLSGSRTALLDHYNGHDYNNSVEDFDNMAKARVPNYFTNNVSPPYWLHADFNMNYDPCTCLYSSTMRIEANLIQQSNLEFEIDGQLLQEIDEDGRSGNAGTYAGLTGDELKGFNAAFKDGSSGFNTLKKVFKPTQDANGNTVGGAINNFGEFVSFLGGAGTIVGGVLKLVSFFTGASSAPSPRTTPMVFKADLKATGTMESEDSYKEINMETPGSEISVLPEFLPDYDNVMGTFNLLTTPKVRRTHYTYTFLTGGPRPFTFTYELTEPLEYVVNPRTGINMAATGNMIKVAYDYVDSNGEQQSTPAFDLNCFQDFTFAQTLIPYQEVPAFANPDSFYVKIIALFYDYSGNAMPYIARYKVDMDRVTNSWSYPPSQSSILPDENCSGFYLTASNERISEVCNGSKYQGQSGNLLPEDGGAVAREQDPSDNPEEDRITNREDILTNSDQLIIYPNPTPHSVTLRYGLAEKGRIKITLMNLQGQVLKVVLNESNHYPGTYEIGVDVSDLSNGTYLLSRETDAGTTVGRFNVQK